MTTTTPPVSRTAAPTHSADGSNSPVAGTGSLLRLALRRSRWVIAIWVLGFATMVPSSVIAVEDAYPSAEALQARAGLMNNPAAVMMTGPAFATGDDYTLWAMIANELALYVLVAAAIMSVLLVVRHTRAEEEAGRTEMVLALPVGRLAPSLVAMIVVTIANLAVGAAVAIGLLATGGGAADSIALGAATAATGLVFAGIAAVTAQLCEHSGAASGLALGTLAVSLVVRGIGDVIEREGSWVSWFSPLAWAQQMRFYVDLRWWPLLLSIALTLLALGIAALLARRRDLGAGTRAARAGRPDASAALLSPGGLVRRLITPTMLGWTLGLFAFALAFGMLASALEDMAADIPAITEWVPVDLDDLTTSFAAVILSFLALGAVGLSTSGVLRLRSEEVEGRVPWVLLSGRSRTNHAVWWLVVVLAEAFVAQVVMGIGVGVGVAIATSEPRWIWELALASLAYLPATALFAGLTMALYGLRPGAATLVWALVVWSAIVTLLGGLLGLPDWAADISPLHHTPMLPDEDPQAAPLVVMGVLAVVLAGFGIWRLRRRDIVGA